MIAPLAPDMSAPDLTDEQWADSLLAKLIDVNTRRVAHEARLAAVETRLREALAAMGAAS